MASILERKRKDGTSSFLTQIVIKRDGKIQHRESKTFAKFREAVAWGKFREDQLSDPSHLAAATRDDPTLGAVIERYEREARRLGRTKASVLRLLRGFDIAKRPCSTIRSEHIVSMARDLGQGRSPATVAEYMTFLSGVFKVARPAWGYPLDEVAMSDALVVAKKFGLAGRSQQRDRRPTVDEMNRLMEFFSARRPGSLPMARIAAFALFSARREGEIVRLQWSDLDGDRILVRDSKDPRGSAGNHVWAELPSEARRIIETTPRTDERIFPHTGDTINANWRDACRILAIPDLRFHDLRHESVSRLFELGRTIPQVASVSGHRSWQNLQRYSHIRQVGDKWANWTWIGKVTAEDNT